MAILNSLTTFAPYHLLGYSLLYGATTYQSFFSGIVAFKTLPYNHFGALQARIFPFYFSGQSVLSVFLLLTRPVDYAANASLALGTLSISAVSGLLNMLVLSPLTRKVMDARKAQEVIDGKSCRDPDPSAEMKVLNQRFRKIHGISVLLNLAGQHQFLLNYQPKSDTDEEGLKTFQKAKEYQLAKSRFGFVSSAVDFVINFGTIKFNILPKLYSAVGSVLSRFSSAPVWLVGTTSQSIFLFLGIQVLSSLVSIPLRYYSAFVLEEKFGFNKQTKKIFFTDIVKEQVLSVVIGAPVMAAFIKIIEYFGDSFFFYVWAAFFTFQIFMISIAPSLIMPLFNKFTPLEDGTLKTRINALAEKVNFPLTKLFLIDGSKRSSHSNAYFTGLPWSKRIVLFDTLLDTSSEDEILAVIGHEIGHWAKSHLLKTLVFSQANLSLIFLLFSAFFRNNSFYASFGFAPVARQPIIVGFMLFMDVLKPVECVMGFLSNMLSRKHEFEADAYAVDLDYGKDLCSALKVLAKENLSVESADPLYSAYHHSHPLTPERISTIKKLVEQKEAAEKKEK